MINNIKKDREFNNFSKIANEWWVRNGKFKILHQITPLRMEYIIKNTEDLNIKKCNILDLGCGGGLVCEPLARLNAKVTGIDFIEENIKIAKNHAKLSNLKINYFFKNINSLKIKKKFDIILLLEVLEHLENWENLIYNIKSLLNKNGYLIISTINRNLR